MAALINKADTVSVVITSGQSVSGTIDCGGNTLCGVILPAAWDSAKVSFQVSADNATFAPLYDLAGIMESAAAQAAGDAIALDPAKFLGWRYIKVVSGVPSALVNQTANRTIVVQTRDLG